MHLIKYMHTTKSIKKVDLMHECIILYIHAQVKRRGA